MLNYNDLTRVLIKIAGAIIIAFAISGMPSYLSYYFSLRLPDESVWLFFSYTVLPMAVPLCLGVVMLYLPGTIANKIVSPSERGSPAVSDLEGLQVVAFGVLGLYLLFQVLSDFIFNFSVIFLNKQMHAVTNISDIETYSRIIATVAELFFALYLLLGAKRLSGLISSLRR
jgi:hypothetical protein